jgi:hypothetical protein
LKVATGTGSLVLYLTDGNGFGSPASPITVPLTVGWRRFSITDTFPSVVTSQGGGTVGVILRSTGAGTVHAWGAQLERWSSPTSYVVTTNNAPQTPRGLVTFNSAPAANLQVTADFSYYYRCRFLEDELNDLEEFLFQLWDCKSLKFRSVLL